jgi:hypothetical protein
MGARGKKEPRALYQALGSFLGSGGRIRTGDLRVMSPTSCHCSTPRRRGRQRPIVPASHPASIVGAGALHDRVRDGNGWDRSARVTASSGVQGTPGPGASRVKGGQAHGARSGGWRARAREQARRPRPLVSLRSDRCRPSTWDLSTRWSIWGLTRLTRWETSSWGALRT